MPTAVSCSSCTPLRRSLSTHCHSCRKLWEVNPDQPLPSNHVTYGYETLWPFIAKTRRRRVLCGTYDLKTLLALADSTSLPSTLGGCRNHPYCSSRQTLHGKTHLEQCTQRHHAHNPEWHFGGTGCHRDELLCSVANGESTAAVELAGSFVQVHPPRPAHHQFWWPELR